MRAWPILVGVLAIGILLMSEDVIGSDKDVFPDNWDRLLRAAARKHGLPPEMVKAVAANESMVGRFTQLESIGNTTGIMHIKLATARELIPGLTQEQLNRPEVDIDVGVRYLKKMWDRYAKYDTATRTRLAIMAYNGGPGRADQYQEYVTTGKFTPLKAIAGDSLTKFLSAKSNMEEYLRRYNKHYSQLIA